MMDMVDKARAWDELAAKNAEIKLLRSALIEIADRDWGWSGGGSEIRNRGSYGLIAARTLGIPLELSPGWPNPKESETRNAMKSLTTAERT